MHVEVLLADHLSLAFSQVSYGVGLVGSELSSTEGGPFEVLDVLITVELHQSPL